MRHVGEISVLKDFDGFTANVVEVVTRVIQKSGTGMNAKRWVSYKGKKCYIFGLGKSYNLTYCSCISVKS